MAESKDLRATELTMTLIRGIMFKVESVKAL